MTSKIALVATFKMIADFRNKIGHQRSQALQQNQRDSTE